MMAAAPPPPPPRRAMRPRPLRGFELAAAVIRHPDDLDPCLHARRASRAVITPLSPMGSRVVFCSHADVVHVRRAGMSVGSPGSSCAPWRRAGCSARRCRAHVGRYTLHVHREADEPKPAASTRASMSAAHARSPCDRAGNIFDAGLAAATSSTANPVTPLRKTSVSPSASTARPLEVALGMEESRPRHGAMTTGHDKGRRAVRW